MTLTESQLYDLGGRRCDHSGLMAEIRKLDKIVERQRKRIDNLAKKIRKLEKRK